LIVAVVFELTEVVFTVKVADVFPAAIVTVDGTVAAERLLDRVMTRPPVGAAALTVTVPVLDFPGATVAGLKVTDLIVGGVIVSVADCVTPLRLPEIDAVF
jgi:hypothetical protein